MRYGFLSAFFLISFLGPFYAKALCVNASKANLRSRPSARSSVSWVVGRFTPLVHLKTQGAWFQVKDQDGERHWVHRSLVTRGFRCLSIKTKWARLRTGPGSHFPTHKYRAAEKYETFMRLKKEGRWYFVKNNYGKKLWVHRSNVWIPRKNISISF